MKEIIREMIGMVDGKIVEMAIVGYNDFSPDDRIDSMDTVIYIDGVEHDGIPISLWKDVKILNDKASLICDVEDIIKEAK